MRIRSRTLRFIEFLVIGLILGMFEDVLAVKFVTGERITLQTIGIIFMVALPFAFLSEYVVDHPRFWKVIFRIKDESVEPQKVEQTRK